MGLRAVFISSMLLLLAVSLVYCSNHGEEIHVLSGKCVLEELDFGETVEIHEEDESRGKVRNGEEIVSLKIGDDDGSKPKRDSRQRLKFPGRERRQAPSSNQFDLSVSQECNGITLRWVKPNIPFSTTYHTSNAEFSHYNIYRETSFFSSVVGLKPIASGKVNPELKNLQLVKWIDRFPPTGSGLFYAVTVVNHKGVETQNVLPKQISFSGSYDNVGGSPVRIIPNIIRGNVIHHDIAYNNFRNEYFVVFDVDQNNDNRGDRVYGMRINAQGQILDKNVIDFTLGGLTTEQAHPAVAFNPSTQEFLVVFHLSAPTVQSGAHVIIGQRVFGHQTVRSGSPWLVLNGKGKNGFVPVIEPKLIYNAGSGGYAMTAMMVEPPKTAFVVFMKSDGKGASLQRLFAGEVLEANLFMDTKHRHIYIAYQIPQWSVTLTDKSDTKLQPYPYLIAITKANATGALLPLADPNSVRYLAGYTREKVGNIDGYFDEKNGWLSLFWNNQENGKNVITSSIVVGVPGRFNRETNTHNCPSHIGVKNAATCFLPSNNAHIMLWEKGNIINGYLVKDGAFNPVLGVQRRPKIVYNPRENRALGVYQQVVGGVRVLFVRNIAPASHSSCRLGCKSSERCVMKDTCTPRNPGATVNLPTCLINKGGCSHICTSLAHGRLCSCPSSHTLDLDGQTCFRTAGKPDVSLLYSSTNSIWSASVYYAEKRVSFARIPIQGQHIIAFFYNAQDKYLYWGDAGEQKIYRSHLDGANKQAIVNNQVLLPDGMVVDPVAQQLYWADGALNIIYRCLLDGANVQSFITGVEKPRALAVHKKNKWLFWTSWGVVAKIERINTDGTNRRLLISTQLKWPNGLTHDEKYLYWTDAHFDKIEKSDLNGNNRVIVTTRGLVHPYGLGIAGNRLYWTDWSGHIRSLDKRHAYLPPDEIAFGLKKPFSLQIYDGSAFTKASVCSDPGVPLFGGRNPPPKRLDGKYDVGDLLIFTCNPGFVHLGSNSRQCLPTGKWSGSNTQCKALPVFTKVPSNKTVDVSYSVAIQCSADTKSGDKAIVTWYKDGTKVAPSFRAYVDKVTGYLHIPSALTDDTGLYTCEASNAAGKIQASMYLTVRQKQRACGKAKFAPRAKIIGGMRAARGSIPWQILLFNKQTGRPFCGGSLLNEKWGVTAAHCLKHTNLKSFEAILGEHNWSKDEKTEQRLTISQVHFHSQYNPSTFDSDIALFKFTKQAVYTDYVIPVCLPSSSADFALSTAGKVGTVSGWGARKMNRSNSVKTLHEVEVPVVSHQTCKANHSPTYFISANMLCAGRTDGKGDACQGDSGGPLTVENSGTQKRVLVGVVSWGVSCGKINKYGVYTKVENFLPWINGLIKHV